MKINQSFLTMIKLFVINTLVTACYGERESVLPTSMLVETNRIGAEGDEACQLFATMFGNPEGQIITSTALLGMPDGTVRRVDLSEDLYAMHSASGKYPVALGEECVSPSAIEVMALAEGELQVGRLECRRGFCR